jgi:PAS domain S-box-containing protein
MELVKYLTNRRLEPPGSRRGRTFAVVLLAAGTLAIACIAWAVIQSRSQGWAAQPAALAAIGLALMALVALLSAYSLRNAMQRQAEQARALQRMNQELDRRVEERTRDLADALVREQGLASRNQAILEGIADGVIVFDREGRVVVANPACCRLLRRSMAQIAGLSMTELTESKVTTPGREGGPRAPGDAAYRQKIKVVWDSRTLSIIFAPVRDQKGQIIGTVAVLHDFTREAEIDRLKSDFVSVASHEVRAPLSFIKSYLELMVSGAVGPVSEEQLSFLQTTLEAADRLYRLTDNLLDVSRIEAGAMALEMRPVSLPAVITQVGESVRRQFTDRQLQLRLDLQPGLPPILGDAERIEQVMYNLLSNAYKYTAEGSVTVRAWCRDDQVQVDVQDTGYGISAEDQEQLFNRFFRSADSAVRRQPGSGLGLNITRSVIEMHGGEIWLTSEPAKGSTFSFVLPAAPASVAQAQLPVPQA